MCNHLMTLEELADREKGYLDGYLKFLRDLKNQDQIGKWEVIKNIGLNFYNLEGLSEQEWEVYKDQNNFKELLVSPWIRIVKD